MINADYIIVGAGSAGCALACRLSGNPRIRVLVLECGGSDAGPLIQMPGALPYPRKLRMYDWGFKSAPEPHLGGRCLTTPRGKVVGGSSSVNGMVYVRGHPYDFDAWEEMGARNWGYRHVLPYFMRMENCEGGESGWRGTDGPLHVIRGSKNNPLYDAFLESGASAGYPLTEDYNGSRQEGFADMEMTVHQGRRWSAANAYLKPALKRPNVVLIKGACVRKVLLEGTKAVGVEFDKGNGIEIAKSSLETILSASSINSPKILMLSGIGPADVLKGAGLEVRADRPGVGENLQDHLEVYFQQECLQPITLNRHWNMFSKALIGLQWMLSGKGLGASNHFEACAFVRSGKGVKYPDIQYHFLPIAVQKDRRETARMHGFQAHVGPTRSKSKGRITVRSADHRMPPLIHFNYMSREEDWQQFRTCIRLTRELFAQPAFDAFRGKELKPGEHVQSDEEIDDFIRDNSESAYHPCGTCRMGDPNDSMAVVDPECRVIGVEGLRVVDSSIFPQITNGNLNAPSIMTAEKASDIILGRSSLPAMDVEPRINENWQTSQR